MARVTYGAYITELKGSIAGTTFQRNKAGKMAKSRAFTPVNPSQLQSNHQLWLVQLVASWGSLSAYNKGLWNTLASEHDHTDDWGVTKTISGYQWYISYNLNMLLQEMPVVEYPAEFEVIDPAPDFELTADGTHLYIHYTGDNSEPGEHIGVFATPPLKQTNINLRRSLLQIQVRSTTSGAYRDITSFYESTFNLSWASFYSTAECNIIVRTKIYGSMFEGGASVFKSAIIQLT